MVAYLSLWLLKHYFLSSSHINNYEQEVLHLPPVLQLISFITQSLDIQVFKSSPCHSSVQPNLRATHLQSRLRSQESTLGGGHTNLKMGHFEQWKEKNHESILIYASLSSHSHAEKKNLVSNDF